MSTPNSDVSYQVVATNGHVMVDGLPSEGAGWDWVRREYGETTAFDVRKTAQIDGDVPDPEQTERDERTDLCDECKPIDHATCSMTATCACCRTTIEALDDEGGS